MSTKIYDAYKFHGKISDLPMIFNDMKIKYLDGGFFKEKLLRYYNPYDRINFEYNKKVIYYLKDIDSRWCLGDFITDTKEGKEFVYTFSISSVVLFDNDDIYVMFFNTPYDLIDNKLFTDFHYQDSSDMSNYDETKEPWLLMSDERKKELENDWDNRYNTWNRIFDVSWSPKDVGLTYDMSIFNDIMLKRTAFHIFKDSLNDVKLIRKIKIKRLNYILNHKQHIDKIKENGGSVHDITDYCIENGIKISELGD